MKSIVLNKPLKTETQVKKTIHFMKALKNSKK
jgi:hypothetical protein